MFKKHGLNNLYAIEDDILERYLTVLEEKYIENPYHNATHASDVMNSTFFLIKSSVINDHLTNLEIMGALISSLGHDVGHFALTNRFCVAARHEVALKYNDASVLENMHASITFELLTHKDKDILANLESADWMFVRRVILEMILATDMAKHFELLGQFRAKINSGSDHDLTSADERLFLLRFILKCSDIGHAAKQIDLHE
jgi:hypothetical protein